MLIIDPKKLGRLLPILGESDQALFDAAVVSFLANGQACPHCGRKGCMKPAATYFRSMISIENGARISRIVSVPLLRCPSCGTSHALLPAHLIPFASYTIRFVLFTLYRYLHRRGKPVRLLCSELEISPSTLYDWIHLFLRHHALWYKARMPLHGLTRKLLGTVTRIPDFPVLFFRKLLFPFLSPAGERLRDSHLSPPE